MIATMCKAIFFLVTSGRRDDSKCLWLLQHLGAPLPYQLCVREVTERQRFPVFNFSTLPHLL